MLGIWLDKLKGRDKYETLENLSIFFILTGVVLLSLGIGLSVLTPKGLSVILAMLGSFVSFIFTIVLIFVWFVKSD